MFARIENSTVAELIEDNIDVGGESVNITARYHPDFVAALVRIEEGATVAVGDSYDGEAFGPPLELTEPNMAEGLRARRDAMLLASDWSQLKDAPQAISELWAPYRQELRNVPQQKGFPNKVKWPTLPVSG